MIFRRAKSHKILAIFLDDTCTKWLVTPLEIIVFQSAAVVQMTAPLLTILITTVRPAVQSNEVYPLI